MGRAQPAKLGLWWGKHMHSKPPSSKLRTRPSQPCAHQISCGQAASCCDGACWAGPPAPSLPAFLFQVLDCQAELVVLDCQAELGPSHAPPLGPGPLQ